MNPYIEILRPVNAVMAVITVILMALIAGRFDVDVLLACVVVFTATGAGNVINDYFDHEIDRVNRPSRPIPSGGSQEGLLVSILPYFLFWRQHWDSTWALYRVLWWLQVPFLWYTMHGASRRGALLAT